MSDDLQTLLFVGFDHLLSHCYKISEIFIRNNDDICIIVQRMQKATAGNKKKQSFQTAFQKLGVEYGARTHDPRYHKPML